MMARTTTEHNIVIQSANPHGVNRLDAIGTGTIVPGELLAMNAAGKVLAHDVAGAANPKLVALENETQDDISNPTTARIDQTYSDGDTVYFCQAQPGDVLLMRLAANQSVTKGLEYLASDGNGELASIGTGLSVGTSNPIGVPDETATAAAIFRCKVRII